MKPVIGIMPLWDEGRNSVWMIPGYVDGIRAAGGTAVIFPFTEDEDEVSQLVGMADGILFTGGDDISPKLYGEMAVNETITCCEKRDKTERLALKSAIEKDKAVLGICRGIQFINAFLGGTLYQDLPTQHPSEVIHRQNPPYHIPVHEVLIEKDSPLFNLIGKEKISVNSHHHQAIKNLAPALKAMAFSEDGLTEAVCMPDKKFFWGVQWHPELTYLHNPDQLKIFEAFVEAASEN